MPWPKARQGKREALRCVSIVEAIASRGSKAEVLRERLNALEGKHTRRQRGWVV